MKIESYFNIGQRHIYEGTPCEDYATSSVFNNKCFGVISDGCSGANARTDIGARAWCLAAERVLEKYYDSTLIPDNFTQELIEIFKENRLTKNVQEELASLLVLIANRKEANIWIMGDGGYALLHNNGDITLTCYKWEGNMPFYPTYLLENAAIKAFEKKSKECGTIINITKVRFNFNNENKIIIKDHSFSKQPFEFLKNGITITINRESEDVRAIALLSDGLWSFSDLSPYLAVSHCLEESEESLFRKHMVNVLLHWYEKETIHKDDLSIVKFEWINKK